jgi:hypothetical protein
MSSITTRVTSGAGATVKGSPLTNAEIDTNFINLNTDKVETADAVSTNTANKVVKRDGSGNFAANTVTANLTGNVTGQVTGNSSTATTLQTARTINAVSFDGSANIVVPTIYDGTFHRITNPIGGIYGSPSSSITGSLAVTLPVGSTNSMLQITIKIFDFSTNKPFELHVGGYNYNNQWADSPYAYIVGNASVDRRLTIRFGYTSTNKMVIYIGDTTTTWSYPQAFITEVLCGYSGQSVNFTTGWNMSMVSSFENVTATITGSQVGWTAQATQTTNSYQMGSLGVGTAASGTAGEIRATNSISSWYSDERLKDNIKPIENALDKIDQLAGVLYTQNKLAEQFGYNDYSQQVGVLAGQVNKVQPEAVKPAPFDINEDGTSKSGQNYLTVQYEKLVPLLIEGIKELRKEIKELKGSK